MSCAPAADNPYVCAPGHVTLRDDACDSTSSEQFWRAHSVISPAPCGAFAVRSPSQMSYPEYARSYGTFRMSVLNVSRSTKCARSASSITDHTAAASGSRPFAAASSCAATSPTDAEIGAKRPVGQMVSPIPSGRRPYPKEWTLAGERDGPGMPVGDDVGTRLSTDRCSPVGDPVTAPSEVPAGLAQPARMTVTVTTDRSASDLLFTFRRGADGPHAILARRGTRGSGLEPRSVHSRPWMPPAGRS